MEVTQGTNGLIRMFETDVPRDFLDIKIRRVSFGAPEQSPDIFNGPNDALYAILSTPEVKAYRIAHKIGPFSESQYGSHGPASKQQVSGDLYDVTMMQALDYILQTFPGFWIYLNCQSNDGELGRYVHFGFYKTDMSPTDRSLKEKSK